MKNVKLPAPKFVLSVPVATLNLPLNNTFPILLNSYSNCVALTPLVPDEPEDPELPDDPVLPEEPELP